MGCGSGLARVEGHVSLNGESLACDDDMSGTVCFYPATGSGAPAVGRIDQNGNYALTTGSLDGIAPGSYLVTVRASRFIGEGGGDRPRASRLLTPPQFNDPQRSGFRAEVESGSNEIDFALEGAPPSSTARRR